MEATASPDLRVRATTGLNGANQPIEHLRGISAHHPDDFDELDDVEPPFAALVLGDERLRPLQSGGDLGLGQAGRLAGRNEKLTKCDMLRAAKGFAHATPGRDDEQEKLIRISDYPK